LLALFLVVLNPETLVVGIYLCSVSFIFRKASLYLDYCLLCCSFSQEPQISNCIFLRKTNDCWLVFPLLHRWLVR